MTDVTFTRPEYKAAQYRWRLVRDVCKGSETVKAAGDYYLPRPNASDKSQDNRDRYDAYKKRAVFYNATGRTKHSLVGAVFRTWPTLTVPGALDYVAKDVDGQGVSVYQQSQSVIGHLLEVGRHGLLVDYAAVEAGTVSKADELSGRARANIASYTAESIINWKTRQVGGQHLLSLVVLRETVDVDTDDGFGSEQVIQYRVLRLDLAGQYTQEVWEEGSSKTSQIVAPFTPLNGIGRPWQVIPFQFVGSENNDTTIDDAPLYDMAEVNIGHYRNSADYEEAAYLVGQPQPWMAGLDEQWRDHMEESGIFLGSRAPWLLPVNGTCGVWQAQPNTVAKEAMESKKQDMVSLGARLIERGSAVKTATQADNDSAAEHSVLSLVVSNVSEAYSQCLEWMAEFVNASGEVVYKLNQDFSQITLDATILVALFNAVQGGKLPEGDFWQYLRDRGVINPEKTDDEIRDELEAQSAGPALDATIRHAVFLEQLKSGEVAKFAPFLKEIDRSIRERLTRADLTDYTVARLERLLSEVDSLLLGIFDRYSEKLNLDLVDIANYEAEFEATSLTRAAPVGVTFDAAVPGAAAIRAAILTNPLSVRGADGGKLLKSFIEGFTTTERQRLTGAIRQGFFEGQTNFQIIKNIRGTKALKYNDGILATTNRNAGAIVRTAVQHVATQARMETLKANSDVVPSVEWVSTLDSKTTSQCRTLDKRRFKLTEGPRPPIHINCRSTVVAVTRFSALFAEGATRASVGDSGAQQVRADLSYYDWLKQQPAAFQDKAIGPVRAKLFREGGLSVERFAELQLDRNFAPLSLVQMKALEPLAFERAGLIGS